MKILQILPRVPPAVCGIGDYSWRLARALRDEHDIHSSFLSAGTNWIKPEGETEFPVFRLTRLSHDCLSNWTQEAQGNYDAIILHVSLYGYQKRAVPFWMARAWKTISRRRPRPGLIAMFHELSASGSPGSSAFWLQLLQKKILHRIAQDSDALRTNREAYAIWLDRMIKRSATRTTVMPVFSNFGEMDEPPLLAKRPPAMVMFAAGIHGGADASDSLRTAARLGAKFGLQALHIIGGPRPQTESIEGMQVHYQQFLPGDEVSALLANCRVAYCAYNPEFLGKSTLFACCASHGLAVITTGSSPVLPDGLREGVEVLYESSCCVNEALPATTLQEIATHLHVWYRKHSLAENASSYARDIKMVMRS